MKRKISQTFRLEDRVLFEAGAVIQAAEAAAAENAAAESSEAAQDANDSNSDNGNDAGSEIFADVAENGDVSADSAAVSYAVSPVGGEEGKVLVVLNSSVADAETLLAGIDENCEVLQLQAGTDAMDAINAYLDAHSDTVYSALHIVSHGNEGFITLNGDKIDNSSLDPADWKNIGEHLSADADILIYGCDTANSEEGRALIQNIANLTGADVAASTDTTGADGDWDLEYQTGLIEAATLQPEGYAYSLEPTVITVNSTADADVDHEDDATLITLRDAIDTVNKGTGDFEIKFDATVFSADTNVITIDSELTISASVEIVNDTGKDIEITVQTNGLSDLQTINPNGSKYRVFNISGNDITITLDGLTLSGGYLGDRAEVETLATTNSAPTTQATYAETLSMTSKGGVVLADGTNITLNLNNVLIQKGAAHFGGGLYMNGSGNVLNTDHTQFYMNGGTNVDTRSMWYYNNTLSHGSALYFTGGKKVYLHNTLVMNNGNTRTSYSAISYDASTNNGWLDESLDAIRIETASSEATRVEFDHVTAHNNTFSGGSYSPLYEIVGNGNQDVIIRDSSFTQTADSQYESGDLQWKTCYSLSAGTNAARCNSITLINTNILNFSGWYYGGASFAAKTVTILNSTVAGHSEQTSADGLVINSPETYIANSVILGRGDKSYLNDLNITSAHLEMYNTVYGKLAGTYTMAASANNYAVGTDKVFTETGALTLVNPPTLDDYAPVYSSSLHSQGIAVVAGTTTGFSETTLTGAVKDSSGNWIALNSTKELPDDIEAITTDIADHDRSTVDWQTAGSYAVMTGLPADDAQIDKASTIVTTSEDVYDIFDGKISLREALGYALALGEQTVTFADGVSEVIVAGTIDIKSTITIDGARTDGSRVTIKAPVTYQESLDDTTLTASDFTLFNVDLTGAADQVATFKNLVMKGGKVDYGAVIGALMHTSNQNGTYPPTLTLNNVEISDSYASKDGAGVYWHAQHYSRFTMNVTNSVFRNNYGSHALTFGPAYESRASLNDNTNRQFVNLNGVSFINNHAGAIKISTGGKHVYNDLYFSGNSGTLLAFEPSNPVYHEVTINNMTAVDNTASANTQAMISISNKDYNKDNNGTDYEPDVLTTSSFLFNNISIYDNITETAEEKNYSFIFKISAGQLNILNSTIVNNPVDSAAICTVGYSTAVPKMVELNILNSIILGNGLESDLNLTNGLYALNMEYTVYGKLTGDVTVSATNQGGKTIADVFQIDTDGVTLLTDSTTTVASGITHTVPLLRYNTNDYTNPASTRIDTAYQQTRTTQSLNSKNVPDIFANLYYKVSGSTDDWTRLGSRTPAETLVTETLTATDLLGNTRNGNAERTAAGAVIQPESKIISMVVNTLDDPAIADDDDVLSLREAILLSASYPGVITFDASVFSADTNVITLNSTLNVSSSFHIKNDTGKVIEITVKTPGMSDLKTFSDTPSDYRVFTIAGAGLTVTVEGVTLSGGYIGDGHGGVIHFSGAGSTLNLTDVIIQKGAARYGGGLYAGLETNVNLLRTQFYMNGGYHDGTNSLAATGTAAYIVSTNLVVEDSLFLNNGAHKGATTNTVPLPVLYFTEDVTITGKTALIKDSVFHNNFTDKWTAVVGGGSMYLDLTIDGSSFTTGSDSASRSGWQYDTAVSVKANDFTMINSVAMNSKARYNHVLNLELHGEATLLNNMIFKNVSGGGTSGGPMRIRFNQKNATLTAVNNIFLADMFSPTTIQLDLPDNGITNFYNNATGMLMSGTSSDTWQDNFVVTDTALVFNSQFYDDIELNSTPELNNYAPVSYKAEDIRLTGAAVAAGTLAAYDPSTGNVFVRQDGGSWKHVNGTKDVVFDATANADWIISKDIHGNDRGTGTRQVAGAVTLDVSSLDSATVDTKNNAITDLTLVTAMDDTGINTDTVNYFDGKIGLREAIGFAQDPTRSDTTVNFADDVNTVVIDEQLFLSGPLTIDGSGNGRDNVTVKVTKTYGEAIAAGGTAADATDSRVFLIANGWISKSNMDTTVTLQNLTIQGGNPTSAVATSPDVHEPTAGRGGAILLIADRDATYKNDLVMDGITVSDSYATYGAAFAVTDIYYPAIEITVRNSVFENNATKSGYVFYSYRGRAASNSEYADNFAESSSKILLTMTDTIFRGNKNGAIAFSAGKMVADNLLFENNTGYLLYGRSTDVHGSTTIDITLSNITAINNNNTAAQGSLFYLTANNMTFAIRDKYALPEVSFIGLTINNAFIYGNTGYSNVISMDFGKLNILNTTIVNNTSANGLFLGGNNVTYYHYSHRPEVQILNSIILGNGVDIKIETVHSFDMEYTLYSTTGGAMKLYDAETATTIDPDTYFSTTNTQLADLDGKTPVEQVFLTDLHYRTVNGIQHAALRTVDNSPALNTLLTAYETVREGVSVTGLLTTDATSTKDFTNVYNIRTALYYQLNDVWYGMDSTEVSALPTKAVTITKDLLGNDRGATAQDNAAGAANVLQETKSLVVTTAEDMINYYDGKISLREAILYAAANTALGGVITFDTSVFSADANVITLNSALDVNSSLQIRNNTGKVIEITVEKPGMSGNKALNKTPSTYRVFTIAGDGIAVTIDGFTLTGGYLAADNGGAISVTGDGAELHLLNSIVQKGAAVNGGGVYTGADTILDVQKVQFYLNGGSDTTDSHGAGLYTGAKQVSIDGALFLNNGTEKTQSAMYVETFANKEMDIAVRNALFCDNFSSGWGHSILESNDAGSNADIDILLENVCITTSADDASRSTWTTNRAIIMTAKNLTIINSSFMNFVSSYSSGVTLRAWGNLIILNSTIAGGVYSETGGNISLNTAKNGVLANNIFVSNDQFGTTSGLSLTNPKNFVLYNNVFSRLSAVAGTMENNIHVAESYVVFNTNGGRMNLAQQPELNNYSVCAYADTDLRTFGPATVAGALVAYDPATRNVFVRQSDNTWKHVNGTKDVVFDATANADWIISKDINGKSRGTGIQTAGAVTLNATELLSLTGKIADTKTVSDVTLVTTGEDVINYFDGKISLREAIGYAGDRSATDRTVNFSADVDTVVTDRQFFINAGLTIDGSREGLDDVVIKVTKTYGEALAEAEAEGKTGTEAHEQAKANATQARVFIVVNWWASDQVVTMENMTIQGGNPSVRTMYGADSANGSDTGLGGGILYWNYWSQGSVAPLILDNITISNTYAAAGSAISLGNATYARNTMTIRNSVFENNVSEKFEHRKTGGVISTGTDYLTIIGKYNSSSGTSNSHQYVDISDSIFRNNINGGLIFYAGVHTLNNVLFENNTGVMMYTCSGRTGSSPILTIQNTTYLNNTATADTESMFWFFANSGYGNNYSPSGTIQDKFALASITLNNVSILNNNSYANIIQQDRGYLNIINTTVAGNANSIGLYLPDNKANMPHNHVIVSVLNSVFLNNKTDLQIEAVYQLNMEYTVFESREGTILDYALDGTTTEITTFSTTNKQLADANGKTPFEQVYLATMPVGRFEVNGVNQAFLFTAYGENPISSNVIAAYETFVEGFTATIINSKGEVNTMADALNVYTEVYYQVGGSWYLMGGDGTALTDLADSATVISTDQMGNDRTTAANNAAGATLLTDIPGTVVETTDDVSNMFDGKVSLRDAIAYSILFGSGTAVTFDTTVFSADTNTITLKSDIKLTDSVHIQNNTGKVIDITVESNGIASFKEETNTSGSTYRVMTIDGENITVTLEGLTLSGGYLKDGKGAVIYVAGSGSELILDGTTVQKGAAMHGGGVYAETDTVLTVRNNSRFMLNASLETGSGAAIYMNIGSELDFTDSLIYQNGNKYTYSVVLVNEATVSIRNSVIGDNYIQAPQDYYGVLQFANSDVVLDNLTFVGHQIQRGAFIYHNNSTLLMNRVSALNNDASIYDARFVFTGGDVTILNSDFSFTKGYNGVHNHIAFRSGVNAVVANSVLMGHAEMRGLDVFVKNNDATVKVKLYNSLYQNISDSAVITTENCMTPPDLYSIYGMETLIAGTHYTLDANTFTPFHLAKLNDGTNMSIAIVNGALTAYDKATGTVFLKQAGSSDWVDINNGGGTFDASMILTDAYGTTDPLTLTRYTAGAAAVLTNLPKAGAKLDTPSLVVNTGNDVVNYFDGKVSLREAIGYAGNEGNTITFDQSLTTVIAEQQYLVTNSMTIDGTRADGGCIIIKVPVTYAEAQADTSLTASQHRVMTVSSISLSGSPQTITLKNLDLRGGDVSAVSNVDRIIHNKGGALQMIAPCDSQLITLSLENISLSDAKASDGSAMFINNSPQSYITYTLNVRNLEISNVTGGYAIQEAPCYTNAVNTRMFTMENVSFHDSAAGFISMRGNAVLKNVALYNNTVPARVHLISVENSECPAVTLVLDEVSIYNNTGDEKYNLLNLNVNRGSTDYCTSVLLNNVSITNNSGFAAMIALDQTKAIPTQLMILNSTIAYNDSMGLNVTRATDQPVRILNSILLGNTDGDIVGEKASNLQAAYTILGSATGVTMGSTNIQVTDPTTVFMTDTPEIFYVDGIRHGTTLLTRATDNVALLYTPVETAYDISTILEKGAVNKLGVFYKDKDAYGTWYWYKLGDGAALTALANTATVVTTALGDAARTPNVTGATVQPETQDLQVTTHLDTLNPFDKLISLREAITYGMTLSTATNPATITFSEQLKTDGKNRIQVTLRDDNSSGGSGFYIKAGTNLIIDGDVDGDGEKDIIIDLSASNKTLKNVGRIFEVKENAYLTLKNISLYGSASNADGTLYEGDDTSYARDTATYGITGLPANTDKGYSYGGGLIHIYGGHLTADNTSFERCFIVHATGATDGGGVILLGKNGGSVNITNSVFRDNVQLGADGAVAIANRHSTTVNLTDVEFINQTGYRLLTGGDHTRYYLSGITIKDSNLTHGMFVGRYGAQYYVSGLLAENNTAKSLYECVQPYSSGDMFQLDHATVVNNTFTSSIVTLLRGNAYISDSTFLSNDVQGAYGFYFNSTITNSDTNKKFVASVINTTIADTAYTGTGAEFNTFYVAINDSNNPADYHAHLYLLNNIIAGTHDGDTAKATTIYDIGRDSTKDNTFIYAWNNILSNDINGTLVMDQYNVTGQTMTDVFGTDTPVLTLSDERDLTDTTGAVLSDGNGNTWKWQDQSIAISATGSAAAAGALIGMIVKTTDKIVENTYYVMQSTAYGLTWYDAQTGKSVATAAPTKAGLGLSRTATADETAALITYDTAVTLYTTAENGISRTLTTAAFNVGAYALTPVLSGDANLVVNTTEDGINPFDDVVTLRDAMAYATSVGGKVNITFSDAVDWSANKVIVLTMGKELGLWQTDDVRIDGKLTYNGTDQGMIEVKVPVTYAEWVADDTLTVSTHRVFIFSEIDPKWSLSGLSNMIISGGYLANGSGGAYFGNGILENVTVKDSYANNGGGIYHLGNSRLVLIDCSIINNTAGTNGGGVYEGCFISYNTVGHYGASYFQNSTFSGNKVLNATHGRGNAIAVGAQTGALPLNIINCTIAANDGPAAAGAINNTANAFVSTDSNNGVQYPSHAIHLLNSIVIGDVKNLFMTAKYSVVSSAKPTASDAFVLDDVTGTYAKADDTNLYNATYESVFGTNTLTQNGNGSWTIALDGNSDAAANGTLVGYLSRTSELKPSVFYYYDKAAGKWTADADANIICAAMETVVPAASLLYISDTVSLPETITFDSTDTTGKFGLTFSVAESNGKTTVYDGAVISSGLNGVSRTAYMELFNTGSHALGLVQGTVVNSLDDAAVINPFDDAITLREAVEYAMTINGNVTFDSSILDAGNVIQLVDQILITGNVTIDGTVDDGRISIKAAADSRVFKLNDRYCVGTSLGAAKYGNFDVTLTNMDLAGGDVSAEVTAKDENNPYATSGSVILNFETDLTMENVSITGGTATGQYTIGLITGGAILVDKGANATNLILRNVTMTDLTGGAIVSCATSTLLDGISVSNSSAQNGGAVSLQAAGTIRNSTFTNNSVTSHGGALCGKFDLIENVTISNNKANSNGGGIDISSNAVLKNVSIVNNTSVSDKGGGINISGNAKVVMINCTVSGNIANCTKTDDTTSWPGYSAGAISYSKDATGELTLINTTVAGNTGVYIGGINMAKGTLNLVNSIVADNYATDTAAVAADIRIADGGTVNAVNSVSSYVFSGATAGQLDANGNFVLDDQERQLFKSYTADSNGNDLPDLTVSTEPGKTVLELAEHALVENMASSYITYYTTTADVTGARITQVGYAAEKGGTVTMLWSNKPNASDTAVELTADQQGTAFGSTYTTVGAVYKAFADRASTVVTTANDVTGDDGLTSFREAVETAGTGYGWYLGRQETMENVVTFADSITAITLTSALSVSNDLTLSDASGIAIDGANYLTLGGKTVFDGVFTLSNTVNNGSLYVNAGSTLTLSGITNSGTVDVYGTLGGSGTLNGKTNYYDGSTLHTDLTYETLTVSGNVAAAAGTVQASALTVNSGAVLDAEGLAAGELANNGEIQVSGSFTVTTTPANYGNVTYDGADQTVAADAAYTALVINGTGATAAEVTATTTTIGSGADLTVSGDFEGGTLTNAGDLTLNGMNNVFAVTQTGAGNVTYGAAADGQQIYGVSYGTLTLSGGSKSTASGVSITADTLSVAAGTDAAFDTAILAVTALANSGSITLLGQTNAISGLAATHTDAGNVTYGRNGDQAVLTGFAYKALSLSGSGTKSATGDVSAESTAVGSGTALTVSGNFNGGELTNSGALTLSGADNSFTAASGAGDVTYNGADQNIVAGVSYDDLTLSGSGTKTAAGDVTVAGTLTNGAELALTGSLSVANGTDALGNVTYNGTGTQNVQAGTYTDLTLQNGSKVLSSTAETVVDGTFTAEDTAISSDTAGTMAALSLTNTASSVAAPCTTVADTAFTGVNVNSDGTTGSGMLYLEGTNTADNTLGIRLTGVTVTAEAITYGDTMGSIVISVVNAAGTEISKDTVENLGWTWTVGNDAMENATTGTAYELTAAAASLYQFAGDVNVIIDQRAITISAEDHTVTYNGAEQTLTSAAITTGSLIAGQSLDNYSFAEKYIDAGTYNDIKPVYAAIIDANGADVTANYAITYEGATLTIEQLAVTVTATDRTVTYNGAEQTLTDATLAGQVAGHTLNSWTFNTGATDVGSYDIAADTAVITDATGADVTANYAITFAEGVLTIEQLGVTVTATDRTVTYNGAEQTLTDATIAGQVDGHTLNCWAITAGATDAGSHNIAADSAVITDATGANVTDNYAITFAEGVLTIEQLAVTVTATDRTVTYNGAEQTLSEAALAGQVDGHSLSDWTFTANGTDVGSYAIGVDQAVIIDAAGADVTKNYIITYEGADLTIEQAELTISGITAVGREYDGTTAVGLDYSNVVFGGICGDDQLTVSATGELDNANVGNGKVVAINGLTVSGDKVANYYLSADSQAETTVDIAKRVVEVTALDAEIKTGDVPVLNYTYDANRLVGSDKFTGELSFTGEVDRNGKVQKAGEYEITLGTLAVTDNYDVQLVNTAYLTVVMAGGGLTTEQLSSPANPNISSGSFAINSEHHLAPSAGNLVNISSTSYTNPQDLSLLFSTEHRNVQQHLSGLIAPADTMEVIGRPERSRIHIGDVPDGENAMDIFHEDSGLRDLEDEELLPDGDLLSVWSKHDVFKDEFDEAVEEMIRFA